MSTELIPQPPITPPEKKYPVIEYTGYISVFENGPDVTVIIEADRNGYTPDHSECSVIEWLFTVNVTQNRDGTIDGSLDCSIMRLWGHYTGECQDVIDGRHDPEALTQWTKHVTQTHIEDLFEKHN